LVLLLVYSRLFGMTTLWHGLLAENYVRVFKNAAEECTELLGYSLIMAAALTYAAQRVRERRRALAGSRQEGHDSPLLQASIARRAGTRGCGAHGRRHGRRPSASEVAAGRQQLQRGDGLGQRLDLRGLEAATDLFLGREQALLEQPDHGLAQPPAARLRDALDALGQDRIDVAQHQVGHGSGGVVRDGGVERLPRSAGADERRRERQRGGAAAASRIRGHSHASRASVGITVSADSTKNV